MSVPCSRCGGTPDIHNTNRGRDFVGHEYEVTTGLYPGTDSIESPEEGDFVSHDGGRTWYEVGQTARRPIVEVTEGTTAEKLLRAYADSQKFWPAAWLISDHGNEIPFKYHI